MKGFLSHLLTAVLGAGIVLAGFIYLDRSDQYNSLNSGGSGSFSGSSFGKSVGHSQAVDSLNNIFSVGFGPAAEKSLEPVVHIRCLIVGNQDSQDFLGDGFWGNTYPNEIQNSSGSGVIVTSDGYIVTNNHVVDNARQINVTLFNKRAYRATVVGADPSTDLAVIKIDEDDLPISVLANSEKVRVGDWVLAVGNPFNLASTVTAGIVSAKARNIHILSDISAVESFIQTDAAVNPGNSGGALVNLDGDLIGINTAIATPTGTYAGYSFAVPSNIVKRVVDDLIKHGKVQRGYMGVVIKELEWTQAQKLGLNTNDGVVVDRLVADGAAYRAGLKTGDVITKINGTDIKSAAQLIEIVASHRPGDEIILTVQRNGIVKRMEVELQRA